MAVREVTAKYARVDIAQYGLLQSFQQDMLGTAILG